MAVARPLSAQLVEASLRVAASAAPRGAGAYAKRGAAGEGVRTGLAASRPPHGGPAEASRKCASTHWSVVTSDGVSIGSVTQVEGDKQDDIFDGLAVQPTQLGQIVYVPGEQVGLIYPGRVTLKIASAEADSLEPFQAPPPETKWLPGKPPSRLSRWMRGGR